MKNKRRLTVLFFIIFAAAPLFSQSVCAESFFEYYFIPGETESAQDEASEEFGDFIDKLPSEIKDALPDKMLSGNLSDVAEGAEEVTQFSFIWNKIVKSAASALFPSLKSGMVILGILILGAALRAVKNGLGDGGTGELAGSVINAGIAVSLIGTEIIAVETAESFKTVICGLMNGMVPLLGAVYAASGNAGTAAVQSGGVLLLVTLCQNLFAYVLMPSVRICLVLSAAGAVFPDIGIKSVTTVFRNISTGIMLSAMTLFSFMLGLQNTIAQSADSFGARSIKFAVGNLVPIIGGAVSDSLSTIGGSLSVLKSAGGGAAIVIIILILVPTLTTLAVHRLLLFLCKSAAGVLGCESEEALLGDMGSIASMMLAFAAAMSVAFIYALTLFTGSSLALAG